MSSLQKTTKSICQPDGHPGQRRARVRLTPVGADDAASDSATGLLQAIRRLFAHLSPRRRRQGIGILLFMLLGAIAEMITIGAVLPFLTVLAAPDRVSSYPLFGRVLNRLGIDSWHLLTVATIVFVGTAVIAAVIRLALLRTSQKYVFRMGYELSVKMYDTMLHQEYSYHVASNSSAVLAGIQKCTTVTSQFLQPALQNIISITVAIFIIAALTYADPIIALNSLMSFGGIYLLVSIPARRILRRNGTVAAAAQTVRIKAIQEGMGGIRDVLLDRAQPMYVRTFATHDSDFRDAQAVNSFISLAPRFDVESAGMVAIALLAVVFSRSEGGLYAALPMLGALAIGAQKLLPLLQQVYSGWAQMTSSYAILDDVLAFLDQPRKKAATGLEVLPFAHSIELDRIRFAYQPQMPDVLDGVTLSIPKGATVGFIGKTGSGKSTIIDIVMGLLSPREGGMRVDGVPIEGDERWRWQMNIAHVPQAIYLADATIAENIAFGIDAAAIDMDRVRDAARKAHIAAHVETLPLAYQTVTGERGTRLSGGQRQRIGIARALYKRASVLVLDEATSALDQATERSVMDEINSLGDDLTIIIVAHRLSTLSNCSTIYRLDQGRVVQTGSFEDTLGEQGRAYVAPAHLRS